DSSRCCSAQPPQVPKWTQRGSTRSGEGARTSSVTASSKLRERAVRLAMTRSPGSAPPMNTVLPLSRRATPRPSWLRSRMSAGNGVWSSRATWRRLRVQGRALSQMRCARRPGRGAAGLLLLPASAGLVPPAGPGAGDPLLREDLADLRLPLRVLVGHRDLAIHRTCVAVLVRHRLVDGDAVGQRDLRCVAHRDLAVAGEAQRAGIEVLAQAAIETAGHARLDRLDRRRLDGDVRRALR